MYIKPQYEEVRELMTKKSHYEDTLLNVNKLKLTRDSLTEQYNSISENDKDRLSKLIPESFDTIKIATYINNIGLRSGVNIKGFKAAETKADDQGEIISATKELYKTYYVSFAVSTTYEKFLSFLSDLESSLYLFDITGIEIRGGSKEESGVFEYAINLKTYSLE